METLTERAFRLSLTVRDGMARPSARIIPADARAIIEALAALVLDMAREIERGRK